MNEPKKTGTEASTETKHDLVPPTGETTEGDVSDQDLKAVAGGIQAVLGPTKQDNLDALHRAQPGNGDQG